MKRPHYSWAICCCCTLLLICTVGFCNIVIPVYLPYLERAYLTGAQGSAIISVRCLFSAVSIFFIERYYDRLTLRWGMVMIALITAFGFVCFAMARRPWMFYAAAAICGLGYGLGSVVPVAILLRNWFHARRGIAMGICTSGSGISAIVFPPVITFLIQRSGVRTAFLVQSLFVVLVSACIALVVRDSPEQIGKEPFGEGEDSGESGCSRAKEVSPPRDGQKGVWTIGIASMLIGAVATTAPGHFSTYFVTAGFDAIKVSFGVSLFGVALTLGKLACGASFDRYGVKFSTTLFSISGFFGCALCCLANGGAYAAMYMGLFFMGGGMSMATLSTSGWAEDFSDVVQKK